MVGNSIGNSRICTTNHEHAVSDVATTVADVATARAWLQVRDDSKTLINWPIAEWMRVAGWGQVGDTQAKAHHGPKTVVSDP